MNPFGSFKVVFQYPFLSRLGIVLCIFILAVLSVTIIPGYCIQIYSWRQDQVVLLQLFSSIISVAAGAFSFVLLPKYGARAMIQSSFVFVLFAFVCFVFSIKNWVFMGLGNLLLGCAYIGTPAYYDEISKNVVPQEQGRIQSGEFLFFDGNFYLLLNFACITQLSQLHS